MLLEPRRGNWDIERAEIQRIHATAAAQIPDGDGYLAAIINFRFIANAVWTTAWVPRKK